MLKIPLWLNHVEKYHDGRPQNGKQPRKWKMAMERLASPKQGHSPCPWKHIMIFTNPWTWDKNCLGTEVSTPNDKNHFPGKVSGSTKLPLKLSWCIQFQRCELPVSHGVHMLCNGKKSLEHWHEATTVSLSLQSMRPGWVSIGSKTFAGLGMEQFRWEET